MRIWIFEFAHQTCCLGLGLGAWNPGPWSRRGLEFWTHGSWGSLTHTQDGEDHSGRHELRACLRAADLTLILCIVAQVTRFNMQVEFTCR